MDRHEIVAVVDVRVVLALGDRLPQEIAQWLPAVFGVELEEVFGRDDAADFGVVIVVALLEGHSWATVFGGGGLVPGGVEGCQEFVPGAGELGGLFVSEVRLRSGFLFLFFFG